MKGNLNELARQVHQQNRRWWYDEAGKPIPRNKGELLMLVVTEISEAMEGERKNLMDDKLLGRRMAEVEIVDAMIRLLDYAGAYGYDLDGPFNEKMAFNRSRQEHKQETSALAKGNVLLREAVRTSLEKMPKINRKFLESGRLSAKEPNSSSVSGVLPDLPHHLPTAIDLSNCPIELYGCVNPECDSTEAYKTPSGHVCIKCGKDF